MSQVVNLFGKPVPVICAAIVLTAVFAFANVKRVDASGGCCAHPWCGAYGDFCAGGEDCFFEECCYGGGCGI